MSSCPSKPCIMSLTLHLAGLSPPFKQSSHKLHLEFDAILATLSIGSETTSVHLAPHLNLMVRFNGRSSDEQGMSYGTT